MPPACATSSATRARRSPVRWPSSTWPRVRRGTIVYAANFGRDSDTIATMTGALVGAFRGVDALGEAWVRKVTDQLPGQSDLAESLAGIAVRKAEQARAAAADVAALRGAYAPSPGIEGRGPAGRRRASDRQ